MRNRSIRTMKFPLVIKTVVGMTATFGLLVSVLETRGMTDTPEITGPSEITKPSGENPDGYGSVISSFFASPTTHRIEAIADDLPDASLSENRESGPAGDMKPVDREDAPNFATGDSVPQTSDKSKTATLSEQVTALLTEKKTQEAINLLAGHLKEKPDDADALLTLAEILADRNEDAVRRRGLAILTVLSNRFPEGSEKWFRVREREIVLLVKLGRRSEAEKIATILEIAYPDWGSPAQKQRVADLFSSTEKTQ